MIPTLNYRMMLLAVLAVTALTGCSDDDPTNPVDVATTFTLTIENVSMAGEYAASGVFNTPVGEAAPAAAGPGMAYQFEVGAAPGDLLSFATMFVQSNDLFFAPDGGGIAFYDGMGLPVSGDVTAQVMLWDAGSEINQEPGLGADQAPRQSGADTGAADSDATVRLVDDGYMYPAVDEVIAVILTPLGEGLFRVRIENVSDGSTLQPSSGPSLAVPIAPGVYAVHRGSDPLFTAGAVERMEGLAAVAEDGNPAVLAPVLASRTALATPVAPAAVAVHGSSVHLFTSGVADTGTGLTVLAEDGDPGMLVSTLSALAGVSSAQAVTMPVGGAGAAPIFPGESYVTTFEATDGDRLSLAAMFVQSNDLFLAFDGAGLALFDAMGDPVTGDVSMSLGLWDAGSEMNQWPGVGPDQAPRQTGPDTGADDTDARVRMVADGFPYPAADRVLRVTLTVGS